MEKYIKYIIFLIVLSGYAQGSKIEISNLEFFIDGDEDICNNSISISVRYTNGHSERIFFNDRGKPIDILGTIVYGWVDGTYNYPNQSDTERNRVIQSIEVDVTSVEKTGSSCQNGTVLVMDESIPIGYDPCASGNFYKNQRNDGDFELRHILSFSWRVAPTPVVNRVGANIAGFDDEFKATGNGNFSNTVYQWEYQLTRKNGTPSANGWRSIPGELPNRELSVIPSSFLQQSDIGKDIHVRIKSCNYAEPSNFVTYEIKKSAPKVIRVDPVPVSCYDDSTDGAVRFTFDRPLDSFENFNIAVTDLSIKDKIVDGVQTYETVESIENVTEFDDNNSLVISGLRHSTPDGFGISIISGHGNTGDIYFSDGANHAVRFDVGRPGAVKIDAVTGINVNCNSGDSSTGDGKIVIRASGGNNGTFQYSYNKNGGSYTTWRNFTNGAMHEITGLGTGNYQVRVQKKITRNGVNTFCMAHRFNSNNNPTPQEDIRSVTIREPVAPLQVEYITENIKKPTAHNFTNGQIKVRIFGGTPFNNGTYRYTWIKQGSSTPLTTIDETIKTDSSNKKEFFITLRDIGAGTYFLTVTDKNYSTTLAAYRTGCFVNNSSRTLQNPDPLELRIDITKPITCNATNTTIGKDQDGELTAVAAGGVPLQPNQNRGLPYYYTWKKKNELGVWKIYKSRTEGNPTISVLSEGEYAVNIEDANGIVVGNYVNNSLVTTTDVTRNFEAPPSITINADKQDVFCYGGNDGAIRTTISGGNGEYEIQWLDDPDHDSPNRDQLSEGDYTIVVEDKNGCRARRTIIIEQPSAPLQLTYPSRYNQPTGFGLTNGWIEARIKGGTPNMDGSYNYMWTDQDGGNRNANVETSIDTDTNEFVVRLQDVGKGEYTLVITDANHIPATNKTGCTLEDSFQLDEPDPLEVTIVEDTPISCNQLNEFGNPSSDGILIAHAKGGIRFNPGLPYVYTWKKKAADSTWQVLTSQSDSIATNLDDGTYAVNIEDANGIVLGEYENNVLVQAIDSTRVLTEPVLLEVSLEKQDVYCYEGSDGWAEATISGGNPPYTILWNTGEETSKIEGLVKGRYEVLITDDRGCEAVGSIDIEQPEIPLDIQSTAFSRPSSIGANDAWVEAEVSGGTPFDNSTYTYQWENQQGESLNSQTITEILPNGHFKIRLHTITAGNYFLTIQDKNYEIATTKDGCTFIESSYTIYEPLEAIIEEYTPISCNQENEFLDPHSDGAIVGYVRGGVPFSSGLPYRYTWKKQNDVGIWEVLPTQTDSIATNLGAGVYALNATDSMGNMMGIYESEVLIRATDTTYTFIEPELLQVSLQSTSISCDAGNDGTATVSITGGTAPYHIEWSTGETTATATDLISGTYIAYVTDSRGCQASGRVFVEQPGGIVVTVNTQKDPTCFDGNDGEIALTVTGGTPPFMYQWDTGETSISLSNLSAGVYTLSITDDEGCKAFEQIELKNPEQITLDLGDNRTICTDQSLIIDITIDDANATYSWASDNGFRSSNPVVELNTAGIYTATITNALGCVHSDTVHVTTSDAEIDAEFVIATQGNAKQEVVLVNVSYPKGDTSIWTVPEGLEVVNTNDDQLVLTFAKAGTYEFGLRSYIGDCYADFSKTILIEEAIDSPDIEEGQNSFISELLVYPNPNSGTFKVKVSLEEEAKIQVNIINLLTSEAVYTKEANNASEYLIDYTIGNLPSGIYLLAVETARGKALRKLVIQ
ncbi:T9SS type A sorting domain-containing protein [Aquimarina gracilis]|uniref:T9SS type A sorting domain-containing protein n=1 Tax=Aquimarina gracilis TaxID=874422 RepID=A0ABU5ZZ53_9FLAO|nr:T9SS type A sorting domain-containing protein [Aquimarina gracilis]MEB3347101.1 T9SS type A sorting domain-containing protein [Aquimarina gracilis]